MAHCLSIFKKCQKIEIQKKTKIKTTGEQWSPYMFVMGIEYEFNSII
jgi:hypothetical protein